MKKLMLMVCGMMTIVALSGCYAGPHRVGYYESYGPHDGYYDGYYGPYHSGYWNDGYFYYSDGHRYHRDDEHHFRRERFGNSVVIRGQVGPLR